MGRKAPRDEVVEVRARLRGAGPGSIPAIARGVARRHARDASLEPVLVLARRLWRGRSADERSLAIAILAGLPRKLEPSHWNEFRHWVEQAADPDHAFAIGERLLGTLFCRDFTWCRVLGHWIRSSDPRMRLAAAAAAGRRKSLMGDVATARQVVDPLRNDPDPRVRAVARDLYE